ncbi:hypothetical protein [Streptomyces sp. NPDC055107]
MADLAGQQGLGIDRYSRLKAYEAPGFPAPVSSQGSRTRLYDGEQVDAYLLGKPVPPLPDGEDDADLLDRRECAALIGVAPRSWDVYKSDPALTGARVEVGGVEHWPRGAVRAFQDSRRGGLPRHGAAGPRAPVTRSRATRSPCSPPNCSTPTPRSAPPPSPISSVSTATPSRTP